MTPIRETIARAIYSLDHPQTDGYSWAADWLTGTTMPGSDLPVDKAKRAAAAVLAALDEAGLAVVPREPTEAMQVAGAAISHDLSGQIGRPGDKHPVTAETYRAMISASVVE